ncbi:MAG: ABC transporter ATP-binding protein/permease [Defluviitaleaceae bacterium]|nr:ABC transporter ATP-binding protein/permease [Defluviitaleaceae bacterium]
MGLKINPQIFIFWGLLSSILAVLPAIALHFNRQAVAIISSYLASSHGEFADVVPSVVALGSILIVVGLSRRITGNFLYFIMFDAYYHGLQEYLMDVIKHVEIKTLMKKEYHEDYYSAAHRCGSLADFMSSGTVFLSKLAGAISLLVVAVTVSWVIFGVALGYVALFIVWNILMANKLRWDGQEHNKATRLSDHYENVVMSPGVAKELRVYDLAKDTTAKWEAAYNKRYKYELGFGFWRCVDSFVCSLSFYMFMVGMLAYSIFRVADGGMSVDVFLMLYIMGQNISALIQEMSSSVRETYRGLHILAIQRRFIANVPKMEKDWQEGFEPKDTKIVFAAKGLYFSYDDKNDVLHDLNFTIKKGETIALVGANGSGKSTLVKILIGLFAPTKGELLFLGKEYDPKTRGAIVQRVGMFFQDFYIFHASLRENVGFGDLKNLANEDRIHMAMEKGGAEKLVSKSTKGLEQWLMRNVRQEGTMLSGGEKQRVAVSRAHMSDKDVLIFDEPAAALDPIAEMKQFHAIQEKIAGRTAILISHRVGFARLADRIIVLDNGRIVETGSHDELISYGGKYAHFYNEQAQWYVGGDAS